MPFWVASLVASTLPGVNDRQRVLLVVALGLAIAVVVHTWDAMITADDPGGGWFAYAPNTAPIFSDQPSHIFRSGVMWFVGVLIWASVSFRILRRTQDSGPTEDEK